MQQRVGADAADRGGHAVAGVAVAARLRPVALAAHDDWVGWGARQAAHRLGRHEEVLTWIEARVADGGAAAPLLVARLGVWRMIDAEKVLELLDLSNRLDDPLGPIVPWWSFSAGFDEPLYERAYRLADNQALGALQIELARDSLYNVYRMARRPFVGHHGQDAEPQAQRVGMADIHRFLRLGFEAIQPVRDIHRFVETVMLREQDRLDRIYDC